MKTNSLENGPVTKKDTLSRFITLYPIDPGHYRCIVCNTSTYKGNRTNRSLMLHTTCERYIPNELNLGAALEITRNRFREECQHNIELEKQGGFTIPDGLYAILQLANFFFKKDIIPNIRVVHQNSNVFGNIRAILYSCMSNYKNIMPCHKYCTSRLNQCDYYSTGSIDKCCTIFYNMYENVFGRCHKRKEEMVVVPIEQLTTDETHLEERRGTEPTTLPPAAPPPPRLRRYT